MTGEHLAFVTNPGWGCCDFNSRPGLWFQIETLDYGSQLSFQGEEAERVMWESKASTVGLLHGRTCVVYRDPETRLVEFRRWFP